jgi:hypothetical protein
VRLAGAIGAAVLFLATGTEAAAAETPCPVGVQRSLPQPIATGPLVVGCVRAPHIGRREVVAYR